MSHLISNSLNSLYLSGLDYVLNNGQLVEAVDDPSSPGFSKQSVPTAFLETSLVQLTLTNPRHRIVYAKMPDLFNAVGMWFWFVRGSDRQNHMGFYNKSSVKFLDEDREHFYGAWGYRVMPKVDTIVKMLSQDPTSRRAYIPVYYPEDVGYSSRNLPCLIGLHFMVRADKLDLIANMRSSNAYGVFPYDTFLLSWFHEYVSVVSDIELGNFHFIANSYHVYEPHVDEARKLVEGSVKSIFNAMPVMPKANFDTLFYIENMIVSATQPADPDIILGSGLPEYWQDVLFVVYAKWFYNHGGEPSDIAQYIKMPLLVRMVSALNRNEIATRGG